MRTPDHQQLGMFARVSVESRIPKDHPIRQLRVIVDHILRTMDRSFAAVYAQDGRPSIPPERLFRASLLQIIYSVRSERLLMEQMDYNLLFRWFVGLNIDDEVWDHSTFSFNRNRLFNAEFAGEFFRNTVLLAQLGELASDEHFSVDGTLLEAWASHKSFRPKSGDDDQSGPGDSASDDGSSKRAGRDHESDLFRGQKRCNDTHLSTTDPDARLMRKGRGKEAKLCYQASVLMENRNGLVVAVDTRHASGTSERDAALDLVDTADLPRGATLGADKGYDAEDFVAALERRGIEAHVARRKRSGAIEDSVARSDGYHCSQVVRKRIEQPFGWTKVFGSLGKLPRVGLRDVSAWVNLNFAAYNLIRLGGLNGWWCPAPT
jgi:transposase